jgi:hypothetical protein
VSELHALLIGIDAYLPNRMEGGGYYPNLSGCVRDVERVEAFLRTQRALPLGSLDKLTASFAGDGSRRPAEPEERWPTYANLLAAFERLTQTARSGDAVYIHYSGHGNRAKTEFPMIKGVVPGLDEVLVPVDIGNPDGRYLRDIDLAHILEKLVKAGLFVTLVLDSCHSGSATRTEQSEDAPGIDIAGRRAILRGGTKPDLSQRPKSLVATPKELLAAWDWHTPDPQPGPVRRDFQPSTGWLPTPKGYVLIAACTPKQSAYEFAFNGTESSGALTHFLLGALAERTSDTTYETLFQRVRARVETEFPPQMPMLVGESWRFLFRGDLGWNTGPGLTRDTPEGERQRGVIVLASTDEGLLRLNTGEAQGVLGGARFAVHPPDADLADPGEPLATAVIVQQGATISLARIENGVEAEKILPGSQAALLDPGPNLRKTVIALSPEVADLATGISASPYLRVAEAGDEFDFRVAVDAQKKIEIQDPSGAPLPYLRPALWAEVSSIATAVVERLVHLARYANVEQLENPEAPERAGQVTAELVGIVDRYDKTKLPDPPRVEGRDFLEIEENQWTFLRITNHSNQDLNIVVLDLQPDWGISQVYPQKDEENFAPLEAGETFVLPLEAQLPRGIDSGLDVLKIFATQGPADFRWLELDPLDGNQKRTLGRGRDGGDSVQWTTARVQVRITRAQGWRASTPPGRFASRSV